MAEMTAREYLEKVIGICDRHCTADAEDCKLCPLYHTLACGIPNEKSEIDKAIDVVKSVIIDTPYGYCSKCKREFNSELRFEYDITHCPWCGEEIGE